MSSTDDPRRDPGGPNQDPEADSDSADDPGYSLSMGEMIGDPPTPIDWALSLLCFAISVGLAFLFRWSPVDLAWAFWASSLSLGYLTIVVATTGSSERGNLLSTLAFFTLHFGLFHLGFALFLTGWMPFFEQDGSFRGLFASIADAFTGGWPLVAVMALHRLGEFARLRTRSGRRNALIRSYVVVFRLWSMIAILMVLGEFHLDTPAVVVALAAACFPWRFLFHYSSNRRYEQDQRFLEEMHGRDDE